MYYFADFHCDTLLKLRSDSFDFSQANAKGHQDLPRMLAANVVFQCFAAFIDPALGQEAALRHTLQLLHTAKEKLFSLPQVNWLLSAGDVRPPEVGKLQALLAIEGADFVGTDLFLLETVYQMGVRLITLTWNGRNSLADGVGVGKNAGGLTDIGLRAVGVMEELGIIADVSHLAEKGFWDLCAAAKRPFVASHSNAWAVCPHPRNLKDEQVREISRQKGLIGMNLCPPFVAQEAKDQTLTTLVRHMSHIAEISSTDVLCLGCDLDGINELPKNIKDVGDLTGLPALMAKAGFSPGEIRDICASNLLRFLENNLKYDRDVKD